MIFQDLTPPSRDPALPRWAYVRPDPNVAIGSLTTIPIELRAAADVQLSLNVDGLSAVSPSAAIRVEVLNPATGQPVRGFSASDCPPITTNGLDVPVKWAKGDRLSAAGLRAVQLRFQLEGASVRLYAFAFRP
ncbi:MAG: hypothetical protein FJ278_17865 [Planctomycetes bacterium]|nr:hypothetical protein [Planctomycetota bacterium]